MMRDATDPGRGRGRLVGCVVLLGLAGCDGVSLPAGAALDGAQPAGRQVSQSLPVAALEPAWGSQIDPRMTAMPQEFAITGIAQWDGARTLQGIWIAHPEAETARRVRIVNTASGVAVDGALFRRDPGAPGPSVLISSDAAQALGMSPDAPVELTVVAIGRGAGAAVSARDPETSAGGAAPGSVAPAEEAGADAPEAAVAQAERADPVAQAGDGTDGGEGVSADAGMQVDAGLTGATGSLAETADPGAGMASMTAADGDAVAADRAGAEGSADPAGAVVGTVAGADGSKEAPVGTAVAPATDADAAVAAVGDVTTAVAPAADAVMGAASGGDAGPAEDADTGASADAEGDEVVAVAADAAQDDAAAGDEVGQATAPVAAADAADANATPTADVRTFAVDSEGFRWAMAPDPSGALSDSAAIGAARVAAVPVAPVPETPPLEATPEPRPAREDAAGQQPGAGEPQLAALSPSEARTRGLEAQSAPIAQADPQTASRYGGTGDATGPAAPGETAAVLGRGTPAPQDSADGGSEDAAGTLVAPDPVPVDTLAEAPEGRVAQGAAPADAVSTGRAVPQAEAAETSEPVRLTRVEPGRTPIAQPGGSGPSAAARPSPLRLPYVQAGIFAVAANAEGLIRRIEAEGLPAEARPITLGGRPMQRVIAGPFDTAERHGAALDRIRAIGLRDAVAVRN